MTPAANTLPSAAGIAAAGRPGIWSRLLSPSVADFLFFLMIGWSFLSGEKGWELLFADGDSGLHIRIGDLILQTGKVPATDPFSFSLAGKEWFAFEWGAETIQAALHQVWGLKGVALMTGVVLASVFVLVFLSSLWRGGNIGISIFLTFFAMNAASVHFHARPHIFTMLLLAAAAWILERDRRKKDAFVWTLLPITVLWANLHGGFPILFVVIGLMVAGLLAEGWFQVEERAVRWGHARRFTILGAACLAASLINPYGYHVHRHILETMQAKWVMLLVDEFKSPSFRNEHQMVFMAMLFLGVALLGRLLAKRRLCEALIILFFAWASLTSARHIPLYVLMAAPIISVELTGLLSAFAARLPRASVFRILDDLSRKRSPGNAHPTLWTAAFVVFLAVSPTMVWPRDLCGEVFPTKLVNRHREQLATARVFTTDQWSGYLIYKNFPRQKVFVDGRHNYYGERLVNEMLKMRDGHVTARELLDRYQFEYVMISPDASLATLLRMWPQWKLIDRDERALLFSRTRS